mgnify:CR=1 FL=1
MAWMPSWSTRTPRSPGRPGGWHARAGAAGVERAPGEHAVEAHGLLHAGCTVTVVSETLTPGLVQLHADDRIDFNVRVLDPDEEPDPAAGGDPLEEEPQIPGVERWKEVRPWDR